MPRLKLTIEYDGGPFVGWQRQTNGRSVQQALEEALARLTGETVRVNGAGRTDAGVHALGQVAHIDLRATGRGDKLRDGLNAHLRPEPVAVFSRSPRRTISTRASRRSAATISTASSTGAPRRRFSAAASGT